MTFSAVQREILCTYDEVQSLGSAGYCSSFEFCFFKFNYLGNVNALKLRIVRSQEIFLTYPGVNAIGGEDARTDGKKKRGRPFGTPSLII